MKITRVDLYPKDEVITGDTFYVMLLEVPHFPPQPGLISTLVNPSHTAVIACRDFPGDNGNGWAFCDLSGEEKTAIGEALVEHEAERREWYQCYMEAESDPKPDFYTKEPEEIHDESGDCGDGSGRTILEKRCDDEAKD